ncbi:hypothetical protein CBS101457_003343 [Exobasidium rhododendri]|nr:hypothetical protein CBS101457_003343 [Exobasidium rhododendri]
MNNYPPLPRRKENSDDEGVSSSSDIEEGQLVTADDRKREEDVKHRVLASKTKPHKPTKTTMGHPGSATSRQLAKGIGASPPSSSSHSNLPLPLPVQSRENIEMSFRRKKGGAANSSSTAARGGLANNHFPSLPTTPKQLWTNGEKEEAMKLIKEITSLGLDPAQLVEAGIRSDIVAFCCRELNIPFSVNQASTSAVDSGGGNSGNAGLPIVPQVPKTLSVSNSVRSETNKNAREDQQKQAKKKKEVQGGRLSLPAKPAAVEISATVNGSGRPQKKARKKDRFESTVARSETLEGLAEVQRTSGSHAPIALAPIDNSTSKSAFTNSTSWNVPMLQEETASTVETSPSSAPSTASALPNGPGSEPNQVDKSSAMESMRQAALASMKRKHFEASESERRHSMLPTSSSTFNLQTQRHTTIPPGPESNSTLFRLSTTAEGAPLNAPRGPRAAMVKPKPVYHDIDAPHEQAVTIKEEEEEDELRSEEDEEEQSIQFATSDPRQAKRPKVSYVDDYSWQMDAPVGEVDLEAPLPSLSVPFAKAMSRETTPLEAPRRFKRRPVAADLLDASGTSYSITLPRKEFLPTAPWQKIIVDCSDDETEGEEQEKSPMAHRQIRQESTAFLAWIWKKMMGSEADDGGKASSVPHSREEQMRSNERSRHDSPNTSSASEANQSLTKKEQEIREMMAKIQELERKRGQAPTDSRVLASAALSVVEGVTKGDDPLAAAIIHDGILKEVVRKEAVNAGNLVGPFD